uniref:Uncharacterized protein n=1 Tax=Picea glauca TaxID=3330 RepID=A0A101LYM0_PICGL|nr:hypothetical protein ABT39_MTgene5928 [Picea glauca]QHR92032.1 hypothetical protein Q903MT_gene6068 [Picea sitchensis]
MPHLAMESFLNPIPFSPLLEPDPFMRTLALSIYDMR